MSLEVESLRSSFALVVERDPNIVKHFYDTLFERYPAAKALFTRNNPAAQQRMLTQALAGVIENLENPEWLTEKLGAMGKRHESYGASAQAYDWVGECLLATIADIAGDDWTPHLEQAWTDAYGAIVSLMLAGANAEVSA